MLCIKNKIFKKYLKKNIKYALKIENKILYILLMDLNVALFKYRLILVLPSIT